ncbi:MAG: AmmeMemoRadiSam system radical SAM enzyme [Candidatus Aminicenantes bacterium]|jgi:pyruvate formate lyase activating enzyme
MIKKAKLFRTEEDKKTSCFLCQHRCSIAPTKFGICGVRQNREGTLYSHVYGEVIAAHVDPIEKKPLYHFLPGSRAFSIATIGCNFRCPFCQNWQISQKTKKEESSFAGEFLSPEDVVKAAKRYGCQSISYTYTEPTVYFEYAYDTAELAAKEGIKNSFVTNGYMTPEALEMINPFLDACNVDLKSFREKFYKKMCKARLQPVLESIQLMKELGIWIEITTLVVPGQNDSKEELNQIAEFIAGVSADIPWHISRFHPDFKYNNSTPTPIETLRSAYSIGKNAGLHYIYIGNVWGESEDTICPRCHNVLIRRHGFDSRSIKVKDGACGFCGFSIAGVFG